MPDDLDTICFIGGNKNSVMKKYLTYKDDKSDKFWCIEVAGDEFTVTYGKTGSAGTSQTKSFDDEDECMEEAEKLVKEKLKKGYREEGEPSKPAEDFSAEDAAKKLQAVSQAATIEKKREALITYLDFLCETDECRAILAKLLSYVVEVKVEGGVLIVFIPWEYTDNDERKKFAKIVFKAPFTDSFDKKVPPSFKRVLKWHNGVGYSFQSDASEVPEYYGWEFFGVNEEGELYDTGSWDSGFIEEGDNELVLEYLEEKDKTVDDIPCVGVFDDGQNWYLLHPMKKNKLKESAIIRFDHEDCDMSGDPFSYGLGGVIIRELAYWIRGIQ